MDIFELKNRIYNNKTSNIDLYDISMIYGYIYIILLPDERYYIGQKKYLPSESINYYGSGNHIKNIINKMTGYPSKCIPKEVADSYAITKYILDYAIDQLELNILERYYIERGKVVEEFCGQCLNIHSGGNSAYYKKPGKFVLSEESKQKAINTKRKRREMGMYKISDETRLKMSSGIKKALKNKPIWNKGLKASTNERVKKIYENRDMSYLDTEEYKLKLSKRSKGSKWYNNGIINIRLFDDDIVPEGFVRGMKHR